MSPEDFADSVSGLLFDGQTLRIEFAVTRFDEIKPNTPITGRRYPACRLVLPPAAAVDLINRMQQIAAALTQSGVVKRHATADAAKRSTPFLLAECRRFEIGDKLPIRLRACRCRP